MIASALKMKFFSACLVAFMNTYAVLSTQSKVKLSIQSKDMCLITLICKVRTLKISGNLKANCIHVFFFKYILFFLLKKIQTLYSLEIKR